MLSCPVPVRAACLPRPLAPVWSGRSAALELPLSGWLDASFLSVVAEEMRPSHPKEALKSLHVDLRS